MPLDQYVAQTVLDDITDGRYRLLREASIRLRHPEQVIDPSVSAHVDSALTSLPHAAREGQHA